MKKMFTLLYSLPFILLLLNCPTGSSSSSSQAAQLPDYSKLSPLSQDASNPQSLVVNREYAFKLSFDDIFGEVVVLVIKLDNTAINVSGEEVTQISDTEYHLKQLSAVQPGAIERYASLTLQLKTANSTQLKVSAYRDIERQEQVDSSSTYYTKEASKPQNIRLDEIFAQYSNDGAQPTLFTTQALHSLELKVTDAARWVHSAKVTLSDPNVVIKGKNITGSGGQYFFNDFKLYQNTFSIAYFQMQAPSATASFNMIIELLEDSSQPFNPTISQTFYLKGDENPSQLFAIHSGQELGTSATPTKIYQQMTLNFSFLDPAKKVDTVKLDGSNFKISAVSSGGTLSTDQITALDEPNQMGRRTLGMTMSVQSGATNTAEKFSFELLDNTKSSFTPALKKEYYLQKAIIPDTLKLTYKGSPVSETSGSATVVEAKETLSFTFNDPDQLVESMILKVDNKDFDLSGEQVWLDESSSSENTYLIQTLTVASGAGKDLIIEKGDKQATLNFELKLKNGNAFNPSIVKNYYIEIK